MMLCEKSVIWAIEKLFEHLPSKLRKVRLELKCEFGMAAIRKGTVWPKLEGLALQKGVELVMVVTDMPKRGRKLKQLS